MKKLGFVIALFTISICLYSQRNNALDNEFYFRSGLSVPASSSLFNNSDYWQSNTTKKGYMFEVGSIFMLNAIHLTDNTRLGINADYVSTYYNKFSTSYPYGDQIYNVFKIGSKIGPSFSFNPVSLLVLDIYVKADLAWFTGAYVRGISNDPYYTDDELYQDEIYTNFGNLGLSTGFNIRYSILMLGFEFNTTKLALNDIEDNYSTLTDFANVIDRYSIIRSYNISIGLSF